MPRILYINPLGTDAFDEHFKRILESAARPETEIRVTSFQPIDGDLLNVPLYMGEVIRAVAKAEKDGYDAVIIGCAADPALTDAKMWAAKIPVVAPAEAGLHVASMLGRFAVIVAVKEHKPFMNDLVWKYGLTSQLASIQSADAVRPTNENEIAKEDPKKHRETILNLFRKTMAETVPKVARKAVIEDRARAIIFGCTFFSGLAKERKAISEELKVPVMDPAIVSLKVAEMHVDNLSR